MDWLDNVKEYFRKTVPEPVSDIQPVQSPPSRFLINNENLKSLSHKWNDQKNNVHSPSSACNVTTLQVLFSLDSKITDDELWELANSKEMHERMNVIYTDKGNRAFLDTKYASKSANTVFTVLVECANKIVGEPGYCKAVNLTREILINEINNGYPVEVCGAFTNIKNNLSHFVAIVGYDNQKRVWIVNDPWGDMNSNYKIKVGDHVEYSYDKLTIGQFLYPTAIIVHPDKRIKV